MPRPRILILVDWYLPAFKAGGPIRSCANLIAHLGDDFSFSVITGDRDLHDPQAFKDIKRDDWTTAPDGTRICYLRPCDRGRRIKHLLKTESFDVLYLNSLFSYHFTLLPLRWMRRYKPNVNIVLAPRGMLGRAALNLKRTKKSLFLWFAKTIGLYKGITWQASSSQEQEEIQRIFGKTASVQVVANLPGKSVDAYRPREKENQQLKLVFVSRINKKKNLLGALRILQRCNQEGQIEFDIIGPVEEGGYWEECQKQVEKLPSNIQVHHLGALSPEDILQRLQTYHCLFLPTLHENFGHVIFEAMMSGCLVLISDQTPWRGLNEKQIGWDLSLSDEQSFVSHINECLNLSQEAFDIRSKKSYEFAGNYLQSTGVLQRTRYLFTFF